MDPITAIGNAIGGITNVITGGRDARERAKDRLYDWRIKTTMDTGSDNKTIVLALVGLLLLLAIGALVLAKRR